MRIVISITETCNALNFCQMVSFDIKKDLSAAIREVPQSLLLNNLLMKRKHFVF